MCGILGVINSQLDNTKLNLIAHRGPDSYGINSFKVNTHNLIFGHRRLAIVDLSQTGHQPMMSDCKDYVLIFNGEIYNHLDLRKKIKNKKFKGNSDTETILYYLIEFGIESVKDFNGIYAFSFLDVKKQKMHIVRDQFGVKPIYYSSNNNEFIFASEIRPILNKENGVIDKNNLATLLRLRYLPSPLTLHKSIKKLKPGHFLTIDLENKEFTILEKSFIQKLPKTIYPSKEKALFEYSSYIDQAIKRQLMSDVEVGILLSGGVDSAVVAAIAQKHSTQKLKAFTIGFEGMYEEDEINDAKETANILGLDHYTTKINFTNFLSIFKETTRIIEEPLATTSIIPMYYLSKLASKYVKVVLTGQGADEPLGGYQRYQGELISQKYPKSLFKAGKILVDNLHLKDERIIRAVNSLGEKDDVKRFLNIYTIFNQIEIKKLLNLNDTKSLELISYYYKALNCEEKDNSVERMMAIDVRMNLSDDLLLYTDKITMNFGLECRVPMLDLNLINYIESLPSNYRVLRKQTKIIHKHFANTILPQEIINRKKKGFQSPTNFWFKKHNNQIKEMLSSSSSFTKLFNINEVNIILNQHLKGYNKEKQIFLLLSVYYWLDNL